MDVTVVIPWAGDDPARLAARAWTMRQYAVHHRGWRIATSPAAPVEEPWSKAVAVRRILDAVNPEGVLVIADADVFCQGIDVAVGAIRLQGEYCRWGMPHSLVCRFNEPTTRKILAGAEPWTQMMDGNLDQGLYKGCEGGGITVLTRQLYEAVPMDERFTGFGQEDESWALALRTLAGVPCQGTQVLYHLHHEPQERLDRHWGSEASRELYEQYAEAFGDPEKMKALLNERNVTR
jgi:hypothetical protein